MDDGAEGESVAPRRGHVCDLDPAVTHRDLLAPLQQVLHGSGSRWLGLKRCGLQTQNTV